MILLVNTDKYNLNPPLSRNEWTENKLLEPDDLYGYGYKEAVKNVFGSKQLFVIIFSLNIKEGNKNERKRVLQANTFDCVL